MELATVCPRFCSKFSCLLMAWSCKRLPAFTEEISSALVALPGSLLPLPQCPSFHPICQKKRESQTYLSEVWLLGGTIFLKGKQPGNHPMICASLCSVCKTPTWFFLCTRLRGSGNHNKASAWPRSLRQGPAHIAARLLGRTPLSEPRMFEAVF